MMLEWAVSDKVWHNLVQGTVQSGWWLVLCTIQFHATIFAIDSSDTFYWRCHQRALFSSQVKSPKNVTNPPLSRKRGWCGDNRQPLACVYLPNIRWYFPLFSCSQSMHCTFITRLYQTGMFIFVQILRLTKARK